jgi:hypothetical protein
MDLDHAQMARSKALDLAQQEFTRESSPSKILAAVSSFPDLVPDVFALARRQAENRLEALLASKTESRLRLEGEALKASAPDLAKLALDMAAELEAKRFAAANDPLQGNWTPAGAISSSRELDDDSDDDG